MSKKWFAVLVAVIGLYEVCIGLLFLVASRMLTSMLGYIPDLFSTSRGQMFGALLLMLGVLEVLSARDLDRWLVIPIMTAFARLLSFSIMAYYTAIGVLPLILLLPFLVIDGTTAILVLIIILARKEYSFQSAF